MQLCINQSGSSFFYVLRDSLEMVGQIRYILKWWGRWWFICIRRNTASHSTFVELKKKQIIAELCEIFELPPLAQPTDKPNAATSFSRVIRLSHPIYVHINPTSERQGRQATGGKRRRFSVMKINGLPSVLHRRATVINCLAESLRISAIEAHSLFYDAYNYYAYWVYALKPFICVCGLHRCGVRYVHLVRV